MAMAPLWRACPLPMDRRLPLTLFTIAQAGHALVGALMPEYDPVQKISIVPRGSAGGLTFFAPSEERLESGLYSKTYLENQLSVALGGRVAEEIIFGEDDVTTGASSDFMQVRLGGISQGLFLLIPGVGSWLVAAN